MAKLILVVEVFGMVQVAECQWRDGTTHRLAEVEAPDWLVDGLGKMPANNAMRVIGAVRPEAVKEAVEKLEVRDDAASSPGWRRRRGRSSMEFHNHFYRGVSW